jgi:hypothetical protein
LRVYVKPVDQSVAKLREALVSDVKDFFTMCERVIMLVFRGSK